MTDDATKTKAGGSPRLSEELGPEKFDDWNIFRDWVTTLTPADVYDFDGEGRGYKKDHMRMMQMAWRAAVASERKWFAIVLHDCDNVRDVEELLRERGPGA